MNELIKLNAILRFHESNFENLHWNTQGEEFDDAHKDITTGYYELCAEHIDTTAEMIARLGGFPFNYSEVAEVASELGWTEVQSDRLYTRPEIIQIAQQLLTEILAVIAECLSSADMAAVENAGIKSELESIQEAFDLQGRYINKRRLSTL